MQLAQVASSEEQRVDRTDQLPPLGPTGADLPAGRHHHPGRPRVTITCTRVRSRARAARARVRSSARASTSASGSTSLGLLWLHHRHQPDHHRHHHHRHLGEGQWHALRLPGQPGCPPALVLPLRPLVKPYTPGRMHHHQLPCPSLLSVSSSSDSGQEDNSSRTWWHVDPGSTRVLRELETGQICGPGLEDLQHLPDHRVQQQQQRAGGQ